MDNSLQTFIKYGIVGASGTVISMLTLYILTDIAGLFYLISGAVAVELSLINNFIWNDRWTFGSNNHANSIKTRIAHYHVISLTGAVADITLLYIFTSWFGIYYLLSNFIAIVCVFFVNYIINSKITWKKAPI
jgi:dolichol-phosphate mannosyltransferase